MLKTLLAVSALAVMPGLASASTIISNGLVKLGVGTLGQLNVVSNAGVDDVADGTNTRTGLRWIDPVTGGEYDATSHGSPIEGWGVRVNRQFSPPVSLVTSAGSGLSTDSFTPGTTTARSVVSNGSTGLLITHDFAPSTESPDLYHIRVTLQNRSSVDFTGLEYRRFVDWDTSPTPFNEFQTIRGTASTLLQASANSITNRGVGLDLSNFLGCDTLTMDFVACGPGDQGAVFDFNFGSLAAGQSFVFDMFYGATLGLTAANTALAAVKAELASLAWSGTDTNQNGCADGVDLIGCRIAPVPTTVTPTFILAFRGVGGTAIVPPPSTVPLPASAWLLLGGMGALAAMARRRKAA